TPHRNRVSHMTVATPVRSATRTALPPYCSAASSRSCVVIFCASSLSSTSQEKPSTIRLDTTPIACPHVPLRVPLTLAFSEIVRLLTSTTLSGTHGPSSTSMSFTSAH